MEALWSLEDKLNLSTQKALLLFVFSTLAVAGLCTTTMLKKKKKKSKVHSHRQLSGEDQSVDTITGDWPESESGDGSIKKALMGKVRWSGANKWEETQNGNAPPLIAKGRGCGVEISCRNYNLAAPVWQRPILMGERCEFPRFSGVILYDERGRLLQKSDNEINDQEKPVPVVTTTLRDLL